MKLPAGIVGDAHPRGAARYRHWLSRSWDATLPVALVIGINPNSATENDDDGMTSFLTRLLRNLDGDYVCGGYILVNCCDSRHRDPQSLKDLPAPVSPQNVKTIQSMLRRCDFVIASWGTTDYGHFVEDCRRKLATLVRDCGKRAICFSPNGLAIYCSQTSANSRDGRWSKTPVPWT